MADEAGASDFAEPDDHRCGGLGRLVPGPVAAAASGVRAAASGAPAVAGRVVHEGMETLAHPEHLAELARAAEGDVRALAKVLISLPETKTALRGELGVADRVAWSEPLPLEEIKAVGHRAGATVNDVLVTCLTGALGRYLDEHGGRADEVHAFVPFNLRPLDRPIPRELGNRFGLVVLTLPIGIEDPAERLAAANRRMDEIKRSPEGPLSYGVLGALGNAPPGVEARIVDLFANRASMVLTNVPARASGWRSPAGNPPGARMGAVLGQRRHEREHLLLRRRGDGRP
jgi:diacylglycerol O-acyltransferase / wax synthase